jgi:hypothetical protein
MSEFHKFWTRVVLGEALLFSAAALLISMRLISLDYRRLDVSLPLSGAILGASIGLPIRRPLKCAVTGCLIAIVVPMWLFILSQFIRAWTG